MASVEEPDDGEADVQSLIAAAGDAAGLAEVQAGGGQVAAAEAASRAVVKAAEEHGVLLGELQEVIGLSAARSAMQAVSVEDPTLTISEIARCLSPDSMSQLKGETLRRTDRSDRITPNELKKIFRQIGLDLNDDAWPQVFQELERDPTGRISYTEFVDALERAEEECRQCGIAAAMAAGTTLGQSALQAGLGLREAAECAAGAALRAAAEFGMVPADAAALGGRAAAKLASEQSLDRVQAADAAAEAAGVHAMRAALDANLTLEQVADEAAIAATAAAEEAGSSAQHVAEVSARAAGVAAGELAAESGNTAMKSAEIAAKAATKSAAASGLPPYQAVEPTATAAARSATRAALNGGHPYLIVAEITRQLNSQLVENLKEVHQNQPDRLGVSELKDLFSQANIDIHEDTLRQVFEEMGVDPKDQISFNNFFQAVEKSHGIFIEAGKAAASIAGRVMGQNAAVAGDDPEQAGEVAASAAQSAARSSGLSDEQMAEVAVTAAGHAAGSAAIAAGGAPEYVAYVAGQAAINAATTAGLNTQLLPQVIIPVFARAAGRAAAQRSANGRDSTKALEVAAKAASEAGEKLAFMTPEHLAEAAEAASNEASRVLASGPKPAPGRGGGGKGAGRGRGRGASGAATGRTGPPSARPKAATANAPAPKPAAKKAAAKPKPTPKAPAPAPKAAAPAPAAPAAATVAPAVAAPRPKSRTASANNSARSATRPTDSRASMDSRKASERGSERGETPKAKSKAKASSRIKGLEQAEAEQPLPISDGPRSKAEHQEGPNLPPSSRTTMSQTQPSLKAGHSASPPPEMRMFMEPIAAPGQARSFPAFNGPSGRSLQVPASVQRFYTPYIVARPASATIPVAPPGNSVTVATHMSPPSVFRSPSQPVISSPPRTSLGTGPAPTTALPASTTALPASTMAMPLPSANLQRAAGANSTPATTVRSTQASTVPAPVYAPVRSVTGSPYGTPGRYQPPPTVLVSPATTMRVIDTLPPGTMTAPPLGAMPSATVSRFETNREVSRPSMVPAPWRGTVAEPITPGATLAAPAARQTTGVPPGAPVAPMMMAPMPYPFMAYPPTYRPPMMVPTVTHCP